MEPIEWNILATAFMRRERSLLNLLGSYGEFKGSGWRDVIIGKVEDVAVFLETLEILRRDQPARLKPLSQIVPIDRNFEFGLADFRDKLKEVLLQYVSKVEGTGKFYVRVKRRGHKGEISSLEIEKEMAGYILVALEKTGKQAQVNFADPDKIIIVETIGNRAGVAAR